MPKHADLLARATPEMLEELADLVERESLVASAGLLPRELLLLAALARAVAKAERHAAPIVSVEAEGYDEVGGHTMWEVRVAHRTPWGRFDSLPAALASLLRTEDTDA